ncbi:MAG: hypothetical protein U0271_08765 [Polyangiaceae bacterium]
MQNINSSLLAQQSAGAASVNRTHIIQFNRLPRASRERFVEWTTAKPTHPMIIACQPIENGGALKYIGLVLGLVGVAGALYTMLVGRSRFYDWNEKFVVFGTGLFLTVVSIAAFVRLAAIHLRPIGRGSGCSRPMWSAPSAPSSP